MKFKSKTELTNWALGSERLWLFLDYDGTLSEFAPTPDVIEMNPAINELLERLMRKPGFRVTIVSGRRLKDLRKLLPITSLTMAGSYGVEVLHDTGEMLHRAEYGEIRPVLDSIKPQWQALIEGRNGFFLEDKGWTLALHARFADDEEAGRVLEKARDIISTEPIESHFRILGGYKFLEISPVLANKGETVSHLLEEHPFEGARLLFMGDDDKDEEAFEAIQAAGGVAVRVVKPSQASEPTKADFLLDSPADVLRWLEQLL